jgi:ATP synthase protein I
LGTNEPTHGEEDDRLDELGRRIDAVREQSESQKAKPAKEPPGRLNVVYRLSTEFVAAVFVGMGLGLGFDYLTGWRPAGIIIGSILGIATAFYTVVRAMRQLNADPGQGK